MNKGKKNCTKTLSQLIKEFMRKVFWRQQRGRKRKKVEKNKREKTKKKCRKREKNKTNFKVGDLAGQM